VEEETEEENEHLDDAPGAGLRVDADHAQVAALYVQLVVGFLGHRLLRLVALRDLQLVVGRHGPPVVIAHLLQRLRVALAVVLLVVLERMAAGVVVVVGVGRGMRGVSVSVSMGVRVGDAEHHADAVHKLFEGEADDDAHHGDPGRPGIGLHLAVLVRQDAAKRLERIRDRVHETGEKIGSAGPMSHTHISRHFPA
jgi:hypothetical protein